MRLSITLGVTNFSDSMKMLCTDHPRVNMFLEQLSGSFLECFYTRAKVCTLNDHSNDGILDRVYTHLHHDA